MPSVTVQKKLKNWVERMAGRRQIETKQQYKEKKINNKSNVEKMDYFDFAVNCRRNINCREVTSNFKNNYEFSILYKSMASSQYCTTVKQVEQNATLAVLGTVIVYN